MASSTIFRKNRLFAKYGHECDLANELDPLPAFVSGNSIWARFRRAVKRARMVSEISKHSNNFFRSQGAIASEKYRHLRQYPSIIHPFSDARRWWEFFVCWVFLMQFFLIPLDVAYFRIPNLIFFRRKAWKWTRMTLDCLCLIDVCINFATGYYNRQKKQAILSPPRIAGHYITTYFVPDLLSSLPTHVDLFIEIPFNSSVFMSLQILSMLKMLRFVTFIRYYTDFLEQTLDISYAAYKISLVVITSLIYYHLVTCMLIFTYAFNMGYFKGVVNYDPDSTV
ncbi:hypothetical protein ILUMI_00851 [Ignelater luminosus]|uniref:Ion transport domain-containing protein n=1 Tax=Ignelater luminosus TaxID=2038154 RepID=A0A8K0GM88_IGNLU|nr:hypothetical protein ILUMI_00851 [Ignelater luminosus]